MTDPRSFHEGLAEARRFLACLDAEAVAGGIPSHLLDQLGAATRDANAFAIRLGNALTDENPGRSLTARFASERDVAIPEETAARLFAAITGLAVCGHLRRGGPQPAWALLALHRLDCALCVKTKRNRPAGEDDRCDWCGARGIDWFFPLTIQRGPVVVVGDACSECNDGLQIPGLVR